MRLSVLAVLAALAVPVHAQEARDETLADIRQQLSILYVDIQRLRTELSTTGGLDSGVAGNTPLDRLNAIEAELQRLTAKTQANPSRDVEAANRVLKLAQTKQNQG